MALSSDLTKQFAKLINDGRENTKKESSICGTFVDKDDKKYVKLDGSELLTPVVQTASAKNGERVTVVIRNRTAVVTGNLSSPSARIGDVEELSQKVLEVEQLTANKVTTSELEAAVGRIETLEADNVTINKTLKATDASINNIVADNVTIKKKLTAQTAQIENLETKKLSVTDADAKYATIENLNATNADIHNLNADYGEFKQATVEDLSAKNATIQKLQTEKLSATDADVKYANIDFSNIGKAAIEQFYATSGIIKDLVIGDQTITGELVGVTIKGDLIEGGTVVADKLVVKGQNGLYYKLNTDGVTTDTEQTDYNSLNGSVITAKSITASKVNVKDLVAFGATIGGFNISDKAIYSGVKDSVDNSTRGIYQDKDGQISVGDKDEYLKYFKDKDGRYKLAISAGSIKISSSNKTIEKTLGETVVKAVEEFYLSSSPVSLSEGSWSTKQPEWIAGKYIWRRTAVTHGDGSSEYTPSATGVCITGNTGAKGDPGDKGDAGKGVQSSKTTYQVSSSGTAIPTGTWSDSIPSVSAGWYLWTKTVITYTDNTTSTSYSVGRNGTNGKKGNDGKGIKSTEVTYQAGASGTTAPTGAWQSSPQTTSASLPYMWTKTVITYTDNTTSTSYSVGCTPEGIQVGGTNLATNTNKGTSGWGWSMQKGGYTATAVIENGISTCKLTRNTVAQSGWSVIRYEYIGRNKWKANTTYTLSMEVKSNVSTSLTPGFRNASGSNGLIQSCMTIKNTTTANTWVKLIWIVKSVATLPSDTSQSTYFTGMNSGTGVWYQFRNLKLEEGNKATDWSPAPEDVDAQIQTVRTQVTEAQTEISSTKESIKLLATKTEVTTVSNNLSALTKTVSNYGTAIDQNAKAISIRATKEEVTTAVNDIQVGGRNLIVESKLSTGYLNTTNGSITFNHAYRTSDFVPVNDGEIYTISWQKDGGVSNAWLGYFYYKSDKTLLEYHDAKRTGNPFTITITIPSECKYLRVYWQYGSGGNVKLEKGNKATDWTPAPEDQVEKAKIISEINQSPEQITIKASKISLEGLVTANQYFKVLTDGSIEAVNGKFTGEIHATSGSFTGEVNATSGTFKGKVYASDGEFKGKVVATSGSFSGDITTSNATITGGSIIVKCDNPGDKVIDVYWGEPNTEGSEPYYTFQVTPGSIYAYGYNGGHAGSFTLNFDGLTMTGAGGNINTPGSVKCDSINASGNLNVSGTINGRTWYWSGQGGQPSWLWGGNDGANMYVYNPANFSVNYATSSGSTNDGRLRGLNRIRTGTVVLGSDRGTGTSRLLFNLDYVKQLLGSSNVSPYDVAIVVNNGDAEAHGGHPHGVTYAASSQCFYVIFKDQVGTNPIRINFAIIWGTGN